MYQLLALPYQILANDILQSFSVRIHSRIVEKGRAWARLWYLLRGLDSRGSGFLSLPVVAITDLLGASSSTIYQWLREAKEAKAIRSWKCQRGILSVALGGLFSVCRALGLQSTSTTGRYEIFGDRKPRIGISPWGVTSEVGLHQILDLKSLRAAATASTAQRLQQLSRFAAWRKLPAQARKTYKLPQPDAFFMEGQQRLSDNHAQGSIRCCIHIGKRRIWTSRGFIPFGVSQNAIASERGVCDRTVRRHLDLMQIDRRQVVQSKAEYKLAAECLSHDGGGVQASDDVVLRSQDDSYYLVEKGLGGHYSSKVGEVGFNAIHSRFFSYGAKPKVWLYRCNIYNPSEKLCTMSAARSRYAKHTTKILRRGGATLCNLVKSSFENLEGRTPYQAEKDGQNP